MLLATRERASAFDVDPGVELAKLSVPVGEDGMNETETDGVYFTEGRCCGSWVGSLQVHQLGEADSANLAKWKAVYRELWASRGWFLTEETAGGDGGHSGGDAGAEAMAAATAEADPVKFEAGAVPGGLPDSVKLDADSVLSSARAFPPGGEHGGGSQRRRNRPRISKDRDVPRFFTVTIASGPSTGKKLEFFVDLDNTTFGGLGYRVKQAAQKTIHSGETTVEKFEYNGKVFFPKPARISNPLRKRLHWGLRDACIPSR
jgi:hypothetical protein